MVAAKKDLYIEQGATFRLGFTWARAVVNDVGEMVPGQPYDLTGASARMQIRPTANATIMAQATSEDGQGITLGGTDGRVDIHFTADQTDMLVGTSAVYDLEIEMANGDVYRVLQGTITISPNVTRAVP